MPKKKTKKVKQEEEEKSNGQAQELETESTDAAVDAREEKEDLENGEEVEEEPSAEDRLGDLRDRHLRLRAEFDNYRKRSEKEYSRLLQYEGEEVILSFLGIADDLQRMLDSLDDKKSENVESLVEGDGVVIQEFEKGYKYKDKVIRHAKVIVNSKAESKEAE